nr:hypothetical protein [Tanacetum cinerariifolium]
MQKRRNDVKARTTLLLALPDEHQLRFRKYKTVQELWAAILKTFGGNEATKKTKKNLLKQQYGNFKAEGTETLEHTFNRLQIIRNISDLDTMSLDDLYNHLKVYEPEVQKKSESNSQNMAFISTTKNSSGNEEVNTVDIPIASTQIDEDGIEEMDIKWNMALLSMRADRYWKKTGKKISIQGTDMAGFDKSKMECFNCHKIGHFAKECRAPKSQERGRKKNYRQDENNALVADEKAPTEFALMAKSNADNEVFDNSLYSKACKKNTDSLNSKITELNEKLGDTKNIVVPPPPAQVYSPPKKDMSWTRLLEFVDDTITDYSRPSPAIESNSDDLQNRNSSVTETGESSSTILYKPTIKFVKAAEKPTETKTDKVETIRKTSIKYAEMYRKTSKRSNVRGNQRNWNNLKTQQLGKNFLTKNKACYNCGCFDHLSYDCGKWVDQGKSWGKNIYTHKSRSPRTVFHKHGRPPMRTNRPNMNGGQPKRTYFSKPAHSCVSRPFQRRSTGNSKNYIDDKGYWDSGGCKITGKGTIKTAKLEFENVYFVKDLRYNLFSVSQICDNKNSVLFTNSKYIVLGQNFKLTDDTNVLLRTPRQHNMYSIDLNNVFPHKDLTCLVAKASADECMLWHRRLGHLNIKTMNRLVRHNLVRGLPSKCFNNDHTCVAYLKGKQHKASCKTKLVNLVTKPLHTFHMDLFCPTSVSSLNHKWYCLVVTDDFSRFTWTFFLKTKDETSGILRNFITEIENLKDLKAEAVNTACYVQNRVLVNKSQNKTPYELFNGRTPAIGFLKPFRCHVMILNTLDHLGKFEAKGDEGYCIGYSMSSKAFRVFNKRTKRVEENLHVDFLENKAIEKGAGPNWLIDIDSLTNSVKYVPVVVAGTNSTNFSGTKEAVGQDVKKDVSSLRYITLPNWFHEAHLESSTSNAQDACNVDAPENSGNSNPTATLTNPLAAHMETLEVKTLIPSVSSHVSTACLDDSFQLSSDSRLISKRVTSQDDTPSLDNKLTLANRIEAIRLFLAYASFMGLTVYQMDVKSAFLYGTIDEEVYVMQPPRF